MELILYVTAFAAVIGAGFFLTSLPFMLVMGPSALRHEGVFDECERVAEPERRLVVRGFLLRRSPYLQLEYQPCRVDRRPKSRRSSVRR